MFRPNLRAALIEIAGVWGVRQNDLLSRFHRRELGGSARLEPLGSDEARGLQVKVPAFRVTIEGKQPRLLYLETCTRLHGSNQKTPRLILESRQQELQSENGLTVTSSRRGRIRGRLPEQLFTTPLRERTRPKRPERETRDLRDR